MDALVTTDLKSTWPEGRRVLFLGEWCCLHKDRDSLRDLEFEVLKYHWDDRVKLESDFYRLQLLNENLLCELVLHLNEIHHVNKDVKYWRLLLGYWLQIYTTVLFDRWESLRHVQDLGRPFETCTLSIPFEQLAALDTTEFIKFATEDSAWNHAIFSLLIESFPNLVKIPLNKTVNIEKAGDVIRDKVASKSMRALAPFLRGVAWLKRRQKYFFTSTYLHKIDKIWLEFSLCQMTLPNLTSSSSKIQTQSKYELMQRDWKLPLSPSEDAFGTIVRKLLPTFLPRIFLEGYVELASQVDRLPWPKAPKVIFTSNQHFSDDLFKAWAASKVTQGGKLVIGEHGGMGTNLFNASHSYQLAISNRFISTGWLDSECAHVTPVGNFRWNQRKISPKPVGKALLVCGIMPRYAFDIRSMMLSSQVTGYFEDQFDFVGTLPEALRGQLLVRITPTDYGWDQEGRWYERYPCVKLDRGTRPMWDVASECRLFIATYNATTYIDSLTLNFPTIIFWNSDRWEVKMEAKPYFEKLKSVGIFHETPTSAAIQIASIWNDVDAWWSSAPVQKARLEFCAIYSATPNDLLSRIRSILIEEANCANYVV